MGFFKHESAYVDDGCEIGEGTKIWHFSHVQAGARLGEHCVLGQNVYIGNDVIVGSGVKIQNNVSVYTGTEIEDFVFLGPSCVLTNVTNPRSEITRHSLYEKTLLKRGCTVGANATVLCGVAVGRYAFIAAGGVVTKDVPDYALMVGVPARRLGWMSRHGLPLPKESSDPFFTCPESGLRYREIEPEVLKCEDLDENELLPEEMRTGRISYDQLAHGRTAPGGTEAQ